MELERGREEQRNADNTQHMRDFNNSLKLQRESQKRLEVCVRESARSKDDPFIFTCRVISCQIDPESVEYDAMHYFVTTIPNATLSL